MYPCKMIILPAILAAVMFFGACSARVSEQTRSAVQERIRSVLALHTAEYVYRDVVYFGKQSQLFGFIPSGNREMLFSVDVAVRAGVNLRQGFSVEVPNRNKVLVTLPPAEILYADVDEASIRQYFLRESGGNIGFMEIQDLLSDAKDTLVADALQRGILEQADRQARSIIVQLLEDMDVDVEIRGIESENLSPEHSSEGAVLR